MIVYPVTGHFSIETKLGMSGQEKLAVESSRSTRLGGSSSTWRNELFPEVHAEGHSRLTYELEVKGDSVKLTLIEFR